MERKSIKQVKRISDIEELKDRIENKKEFIDKFTPRQYCYIDIRDRESGAWSPFANAEPDRGHLGISAVWEEGDVYLYLKKEGRTYLFGYRMGGTRAAFPIRRGELHCELPHRKRISLPLTKPFEHLELYIEYE